MLTTPAAYPQPGSWALYENESGTHAARIVLRPAGDDGTAVISLADKPATASGNLTVPLSALRDPTPLSAAERERMTELEAFLAGLDRPDRSPKAAEWEALVLRQRRAETLADLFAERERRGQANSATREARRLLDAALAEGAAEATRRAA